MNVQCHGGLNECSGPRGDERLSVPQRVDKAFSTNGGMNMRSVHGGMNEYSVPRGDERLSVPRGLDKAFSATRR